MFICDIDFTRIMIRDVITCKVSGLAMKNCVYKFLNLKSILIIAYTIASKRPLQIYCAVE
jgi:hypothetical protein